MDFSKHSIAKGSASGSITYSMANEMLARMGSVYRLGQQDVAKLCEDWKRSAQSPNPTYRDLIVDLDHHHPKGFWENFCVGFRSLGSFHSVRPIHRFKIPYSDSAAIYDDWFMTGEDLCQACVEYTMTEQHHHGRSAKSETVHSEQSHR